MPPVSGQGPAGSARRGLEPRSHRHVSLLPDPFTKCRPIGEQCWSGGCRRLPHCTALLRRCLCRLHHRGGHCSDCCSGLRRPLSAVGCCRRWVDDAAPIDKQWAAVNAVCAAHTAALAACSVHHLPSLSASPRVCSLLATRDPPIDHQLTLKQPIDGALGGS